MEPCMRDATLAFMWRQTLCRLLRYSLGPVGTGSWGSSPTAWGLHFSAQSPSVVFVEKWCLWFSEA